MSSNNNNRRPGNNKFKNAVNHWGMGIKGENKTSYYKYIRASPVVRFNSNANAIKILKQLGLSNNNSNYYKGNNTFEGHIMNLLPKHRNYYIMITEPFGNRGLVKIPGMVKLENQRHMYQPGRLGLVNKALMNRYLTQRSLKQLAAEKYTLKNAQKLTKVAGILNKSIQRKHQVVKNAFNKWRFQASMLAAKKRFEKRRNA